VVWCTAGPDAYSSRDAPSAGREKARPSNAVTKQVRSYTLAVPLLTEAEMEARALGHSYIGPEHLLLALATHATGASRVFLERHGMSSEMLRESIATLIGPERVTARDHGSLALTHRSVVALGHALGAGHGARHWPEPYSSDDLLVALLADDVAATGTLGALFADAGLTIDAARAGLESLRTRKTG
jgi:ATP-dependent Clp protease ATP-binding subunit ClpA